MPSKDPKVIKCALLVMDFRGWFSDTLFACQDLKLFTLNPQVLMLPDMPNPYNLPFIDKPDVILVCTNWLRWLKLKGSSEADRIFSIFRRLSNAIIGLEGYYTFSLGIDPEGLE